MALESNGLDVNEVLLEDKRRRFGLTSARPDYHELERSDPPRSTESYDEEPEHCDDEVLHHSHINIYGGNSNESDYRTKLCQCYDNAMNTWQSKKALLVAGYIEFKACLLSSPFISSYR